jgi:hypothetical protein
VKDVWELRSVNGHAEEAQVQKAYGDHSTQSANARPAMRSWVQLDEERQGLMQVREFQDDLPICDGTNGTPGTNCVDPEGFLHVQGSRA